MKVDLVSLPIDLQDFHLRDRMVVIFDVLRATTSIVTAIASGANEVRIFDSVESARNAGEAFEGARLLCGERGCVAPPGFDLGNSPVEFAQPRVSGSTLFMSTTNGTRAIVAARNAKRRLAAALVNARSTAHALARAGRDVTLLGAGTDGSVAPEDLIGAGAVVEHLSSAPGVILSDATRRSHELFQESRQNLFAALEQTAGGQNVIRAGMRRDIEFAAELDRFDLVVQVSGDPPVARRIIESC